VSWGKSFTLVLALGEALLVAAAVGIFALANHNDASVMAQVLLAVTLSITASAVALGPLLILRGRFELEVRRLSQFVEALGGQASENDRPMFRSKLGLGPVAKAAEQTLAALRQRIKQVISQRRELEVQVRLSEAERRHAETILNSITDAVIVTDAFNEVALANEAAARTLGFVLEQALRQPVDRVVPDPVLSKWIRETREGGDASLRRHLEHKLRGDHGEATFDVTLTCIAGDSRPGDTHAGTRPETAGVVTILRDITREKEIAEMKSDFVSNVSHELRTPLSSIKAYMEMLVDGEATDEQTRMEFYNIIQGEANRLSRLIDNILNISRIESGVVKVQREHLSLPSLIKDAIEVMQPQARAKQIELVEVPSPLYFQVFADKDMIYQAALNLIGNAIKYTPESGRVKVEMSVDEHARLVNVAVSDTGVGIPEADLPHLFEKFYRVADHKKMAKGTGLGLNLVKHIIETVHGGKVQVKSKVGAGSTFTFMLPIAENG
jgi:two-component system phosphate regulon sensor histidine kinase PhoR